MFGGQKLFGCMSFAKSRYLLKFHVTPIQDLIQVVILDGRCIDTSSKLRDRGAQVRNSDGWRGRVANRGDQPEVGADESQLRI